MHAVPTYTDEEIREIFHRALMADRETGGGEGVEHAALVEAAKEVGIEPSALERAAAQVLAKRETVDLVRRAEAEAAKAERRRRRAFVRHLGSYLVVMAGLVALDLATGPGTWWIYPAIGWGIAVGLDGFSTLTFDREREAERRLKKLERKRAKRKRRKALGAGDGDGEVALALRELERAAERSAASLMQALARKLDEWERSGRLGSGKPR
ncbi:MAG: hypothetical protein D6705_18695 [Deltaproteobacteria bacterium]|nr:MAG: hypothetical protein D6705_18695 [Deltaproteobacteria bacterium]